MPQVALVTDTTHSMPRALVTELGLHEVSLDATFEGVTQREADITDLDDFSARLSSSSEMPGTSQPSVGDFLTVSEPLSADGADIVSIQLSAGISGTCAAATPSSSSTSTPPARPSGWSSAAARSPAPIPIRLGDWPGHRRPRRAWPDGGRGDQAELVLPRRLVAPANVNGGW